MKTKLNAKAVAFIGMLGALATVLMVINFPLPFSPSFMKFDIAELPPLFASFFMGPVYGCLVVVIKLILKVVTQGTETAYVGEFSNLFGSCLFVLIAGLIYKYKRTKAGAITALVVSSLVVSVVYIFVNAYVMFPLYVNLYGMPMEAIIGMGAKANPFIKDVTTMMLFGVFPFNLVKHAATSLVTYLIYKRCGNALKNLLAVGGKQPA